MAYHEVSKYIIDIANSLLDANWRCYTAEWACDNTYELYCDYPAIISILINQEDLGRPHEEFVKVLGRHITLAQCT